MLCFLLPFLLNEIQSNKILETVFPTNENKSLIITDFQISFYIGCGQSWALFWSCGGLSGHQCLGYAKN